MDLNVGIFYRSTTAFTQCYSEDVSQYSTLAVSRANGVTKEDAHFLADPQSFARNVCSRSKLADVGVKGVGSHSPPRHTPCRGEQVVLRFLLPSSCDNGCTLQVCCDQIRGANMWWIDSPPILEQTHTYSSTSRRVVVGTLPQADSGANKWDHARAQDNAERGLRIRARCPRDDLHQR